MSRAKSARFLEAVFCRRTQVKVLFAPTLDDSNIGQSSNLCSFVSGTPHFSHNGEMELLNLEKPELVLALPAACDNNNDLSLGGRRALGQTTHDTGFINGPKIKVFPMLTHLCCVE